MEFEAAHAREVYECKAVRSENAYLQKRVQELEKITKSLQFALQCEPDQGKPIHAKAQPVYYFPVVSK